MIGEKGSFGELLWAIRREKRISQDMLCRGLCSNVTYSRFEQDDRIPDRLLLQALLQRLGKDAEKFSTVLSQDEYRYFLWKRESLQTIENNEFSKLQEMLCKPEATVSSVYGNEPLQRQFLFQLKALKAEHVNKDLKESLFLLKSAIEKTLPGFHYDLTNQYLISVGELQIIIKYAEQQIKAEEPAQAVQTLNTVIQYVEKNIDDYDAKVKIYPKAVLLLSPLLIERNEFVSCMAICEKAIRMLCKKGILYDLIELMQLYVECSKHGLQTAQAVKYEKQLKILQEIYRDHQHSYKQNFRQFHNQEIYLINEMIHSCRISQGLSQEELSDEICATETLSRIECGKRVPSTRHFRALMEKLDTKQDYYNPELNTNNFLILEKHREMLQAISVFHIREGRALLEEIKEELRNEGQLNSPWNKQILLAEESLILFHEKKLDSETFFHTCREVFACEEEGWKKDEFWDQFLTGYKAQLLNQLALVYGSQGKLDTSVYIWEKILYKLEESKVSLLDRYPVSMTAISNLSSGYGILNRLEDCIQISEKGIQFCLDSGRGIRLGKLLVNKAEALESCGKSDKNTCQRYVRQAFYMDDLFEIERSRDYVDRYYRSHFDENIQWY